MGACTLASGCTAFSYNPTLQKCFLKSHASTDICTVSFAHQVPRHASVCGGEREGNVAWGGAHESEGLRRRAWMAWNGGCCPADGKPRQPRAPLAPSTLQAKETVCMSARETEYSCGTWQTYYRTGASGQAVPDLTPTGPTATASSPAAASSPPASPSDGNSQATINLVNAVNAVMQSSPAPATANDTPQINLIQAFGVAG